MKCARTLIRQDASIPFGSTSISGPPTWMPAWLWRMSSRPWRCSVPAIRRSKAASSPTSVAIASARPPGGPDGLRGRLACLARSRSATTTTRAFPRHGQGTGAPDARPGAVTMAMLVLEDHGGPPPHGLLGRSRRSTCARTTRTMEAASTIVAMALISGVTPRLIEAKT